MPNNDHFDAFEKGIDALASRKFPSEYELQQTALRDFKEFFSAVEKWNHKVSKTWPKASVSYRFGMADGRNSTIELLLVANKPDDNEKAITMVVADKSILPQTQEFNNKFGQRQPPRWDAHELDDLLVKMTKWLLEFFQAR